MMVPANRQLSNGGNSRSENGEMNTSIKRGDIRLCDWPDHDQNRHVLILDVISEQGYCSVMLLHSEVEMMTDADVFIGPEDSGAPYALVAQSDMVGMVWTVDLLSAVGHVRADLDCFELTQVQSGNSGLDTGTRLGGVLDSRWRFKKNEGRAIAEISAACFAGILEHTKQYVVFDGAEQLLRLPHGQMLKAFRTLSELRVSNVLSASISSGEKLDFLQLDKWLSKDSDVGLEMYRMLTALLEDNLVNEDDQGVNELRTIRVEELIGG
jgi:hypothetical protein